MDGFCGEEVSKREGISRGEEPQVHVRAVHVGRTVHEVRLVLPLGPRVIGGRAVAHVGVGPVELVGVAHMHPGAVLPVIVVDHVDA